ncbi:MAG TPA: type II toxin-antitoxin system PemK/MazF family toxin [Gemmataceae bacterium]|jgi:mRNA interferase MazF|nr:type II toxin-antitoxin system PemK/MazF family toxin [Gemmataceae bacterium]
MPIKRGDIVLADLPFSNMSGSKIRPALVVQCDANNARLQDVIVAIITRTTARAAAEPTQLLIDITTPEGKQTKLLHTSAVKCEHLITIEQSLIQRTIGNLTPALMSKIGTCLKVSLGLP